MCRWMRVLRTRVDCAQCHLIDIALSSSGQICTVDSRLPLRSVSRNAHIRQRDGRCMLRDVRCASQSCCIQLHNTHVWNNLCSGWVRFCHTAHTVVEPYYDGCDNILVIAPYRHTLFYTVVTACSISCCEFGRQLFHRFCQLLDFFFFLLDFLVCVPEFVCSVAE